MPELERDGAQLDGGPSLPEVIGWSPAGLKSTIAKRR
jgi:hypothetical protein